MAGYNPMGQLAGNVFYGVAGQTVLGNYTTQMGTFTTAATTDPWPYWNQGFGTAIGTATTVVNTWQSWNTQYQAQAQVSQAQIAEMGRQATELQVQYEAEQKRRAEAGERAKTLLLWLLTPEQRRSFEAHGIFIVRAAKNSYMLSRTHPPRRLRHDGLSYDTQYCIHTYGLPREDELLGFKLLLEANETEFLKVANATRINQPAQRAA